MLPPSQASVPKWPPVPVALRQYRARDAEELEQFFGPVAFERRPQQRARGSCGIGDERPLREQAVQQVARERPRAQGAACGGRPDFRQVIEAPAQLARAVMRRQRQAGQFVNFGGPARQPLEPRGIAPVLPGDDRRRAAGRPLRSSRPGSSAAPRIPPPPSARPARARRVPQARSSRSRRSRPHRARRGRVRCSGSRS